MTAPRALIARAPRPRFWADDFDMDLLKILPDLEQVLGPAADVELYTHCTSPAFGRLNHPVTWNMSGFRLTGLGAFFGLTTPAKPWGYATCATTVACSFMEAVRDCWAHNFYLLVEQQLVLDGVRMRRAFWPIMYHRRGSTILSPATYAVHVDSVRSRLQFAATKLRAIAEAHR